MTTFVLVLALAAFALSAYSLAAVGRSTAPRLLGTAPPPPAGGRVLFVDDLLLPGEDPTTVDWAAVINRAQADDAAAQGIVIPGFDSPTPFGFTIHFYPRTYNCRSTIVLRREMRLVGSGGTRHHGTRLQWLHGVTGIYVQYAPPGAYPSGGDGSVIENMTLFGTYGNPDALGGHGVLMQAAAHLRHVLIQYFQGNGIEINSAGGIANNWYLDGTIGDTCGGHGLHVRGNDTNAGTSVACSFSENGLWGVFDESFLGPNTYVGTHTEGNNTRIAGAGAYKGGDNLSQALFLGCYAEKGQDDDRVWSGSRIGPMGMVVQTGVEQDIEGTSIKPGQQGAAGFSSGVLGGAFHGGPRRNNTYGQLGGHPAVFPAAAFSWGVLGDSPAYVLQFEPWTATDGRPGWWTWSRGTGNEGRTLDFSDSTAMETRWATRDPVNYPGTKPQAMNGLLLGGFPVSGSMSTKVFVGLAYGGPPPHGIWHRGDTLREAVARLGKPAEYVCVVDTQFTGTPPYYQDYQETAPAQWAVLGAGGMLVPYDPTTA